MKASGIKSKLLLAFVTVLIIITGLNVGLAISRQIVQLMGGQL